MMRYWFSIGLRWAALFFLSVSWVVADEKGLYRIEVLVFQHLDSSQLLDERWNENPGYPKFEKAVKLMPVLLNNEESLLDDAMLFLKRPFDMSKESGGIDVSAVPGYFVPYQMLAEDVLHLSRFITRLETSGQYRPLILAGWVQSIESPEQARAVYLSSARPEKPQTLAWDALTDDISGISERMSENPANISLEKEQQASENSDASLPFPMRGKDDSVPGKTEPLLAEPLAEGVIRATKSTYFHLDVDMALNVPIEDSTGNIPYYLDDDWRAVFRLFESRRINIGQINYFDHPALGVLVYIEQLEATPDVDSSGN